MKTNKQRRAKLLGITVILNMVLFANVLMLSSCTKERPQQNKAPLHGDWKRCPGFYYGPNNGPWPTPNNTWPSTTNNHLVFDDYSMQVFDTNFAQPSNMYHHEIYNDYQFYNDSILISSMGGYGFNRMAWVRNDSLCTYSSGTYKFYKR